MHMDLASAAAVVGILNIAFLALNTFMVLNIKLAISELRTEISENRRQDTQMMHDAIRLESVVRVQRKAEGGS